MQIYIVTSVIIFDLTTRKYILLEYNPDVELQKLDI